MDSHKGRALATGGTISGARCGTRLRVWVTGLVALVLGLGLPLAPAMHLATEALSNEAPGCVSACGMESSAESDPAHKGDPAHDHDGSKCPTCLQLASLARSGVVGGGIATVSLPAVVRFAPSVDEAAPVVAHAPLEARPRAPPAPSWAL
jgi:hypothetical protein